MNSIPKKISLNPEKRHELRIKNKILNLLLENTGVEWIEPEDTFRDEIINNTPSIFKIGIDYFDDCYVGIYKDVNIEIIEGIGEATNKIFITYYFKKNFKSITTLNNQLEGLNKICVEDPLFSKNFNIYSNDQVEARYILNTGLMERFNELSELYGRVSAIFSDNKLYINISPNKPDSFKITKEKAGFSGCTELIDDIAKLLSIVDILKLNRHTGL